MLLFSSIVNHQIFGLSNFLKAHFYFNGNTKVRFYVWFQNENSPDLCKELARIDQLNDQCTGTVQISASNKGLQVVWDERISVSRLVLISQREASSPASLSWWGTGPVLSRPVGCGWLFLSQLGVFLVLTLLVLWYVGSNMWRYLHLM